MNGIRFHKYSLTQLVVLFVVCGISAQTRNPPTVSTAFAVLVKSVEVKTATANQEVALRTVSDVVVDGRVVIPNGSSVIGHIAGITARGKENPKSLLAVVIDKAVLDGGREVPLQAIIAAVAAPEKDGLSSDPTYGMMHSNEPKMVPGPAGSSRSGELSASSKVSSGAAVATATLNGAPFKNSLLTENSQGAVGFANNLSLSWQLTIPPAVTVFSSKDKNINLQAGTQILLRMAAPSSPAR
jgi:hypothetical protein